MQSPFTWLALMVFIGLAALMLQRSVIDQPVDKLWHYAPPAIGCATVDYLGTHDNAVLAILLLISVIAYIVFVLRPTRA